MRKGGAFSLEKNVGVCYNTDMLEELLKKDTQVLLAVLAACVLLSLFVALWVHRRRLRIERAVKRLSTGAQTITPKKFLALRGKRLQGEGRRLYAETLEFAGVYILYNKKKNKYYVGQAERVLQRVNNHFTGKGNGDVYADYKYGDAFVIRMIALKGSGYKTLNALERHEIQAYDAFASGYNKTRGNR